MTGRIRGFAAATLASALLAAPITAQVTIGTPNTVQPNSFPFGSSVGFTTFQQIYNGSLFTGPLNINSISLFNSRGSGNLQAGTFNLFLSTTTVGASGITNTPANNRTGPLTAFATVTYASNTAAPGMLTFTGAPFAFDPLAGNLLFEVQFTPIGFNTNAAFFDRIGVNDAARSQVGTASNTSLVFGTNGSPNSGFVTQFGEAGVSVVPEPGTWALMAFGLTGLAMVARRKTSSMRV
ncbi:MAG: PEP-CTERM sorting domain-containing protein [Gemmatimonadaceae bacterium]|nr:PEP-CTERM sorting domain-containing protein [Gemmatimonadaceae bacterium]